MWYLGGQMKKEQQRILALATQLAGANDEHEILKLAAMISFELKKIVGANRK